MPFHCARASSTLGPPSSVRVRGETRLVRLDSTTNMQHLANHASCACLPTVLLHPPTLCTGQEVTPVPPLPRPWVFVLEPGGMMCIARDMACLKSMLPRSGSVAKIPRSDPKATLTHSSRQAGGTEPCTTSRSSPILDCEFDTAGPNHRAALVNPTLSPAWSICEHGSCGAPLPACSKSTFVAPSLFFDAQSCL
jgi:hypothetical protein